MAQAEEHDPAEIIGEQVAGTVTAVQDNAAALVESAEHRAQHAAETAEHIAQAARESAIGQEMARHRQEMAEWRDGLESRLQETQTQVANLPGTLSETMARSTEQLRQQILSDLAAQSTPPPPSTDPASVQTGDAGTDGPRESPEDRRPEPLRKKRHVL